MLFCSTDGNIFFIHCQILRSNLSRNVWTYVRGIDILILFFFFRWQVVRKKDCFHRPPPVFTTTTWNCLSSWGKCWAKPCMRCAGHFFYVTALEKFYPFTFVTGLYRLRAKEKCRKSLEWYSPTSNSTVKVAAQSNLATNHLITRLRNIVK